jgi:hypothetical protein
MYNTALPNVFNTALPNVFNECLTNQITQPSLMYLMSVSRIK